MRLRSLLGALAASGLVAAAGCQNCPSSDRAPAPDPVVGGFQAPRFVASSSTGGSAQLTLLDAALVPIVFSVGGTSTQSWISTRSRWTNQLATGIGPTAYLARAITPAVPGLVTILGATSVIALGLPTAQEDWEWLEPAGADSSRPPILDVIVVPDATLEMHDLAFVARDRVQQMMGGPSVGGDIVVLDVESNRPTLLGTVSLDGIAASGLEVSARSFTLAGGLVYAALAHQSGAGPTGSPPPQSGDGIIVVIDPRSRAVRTVLRAPGRTHCEQVVSLGGTPPSGRVVAACSGTPSMPGAVPSDAGLVLIDRDPDPVRMEAAVVTQTLTASLLAIPSPDHGLLALAGPWIAFVSRGSTAAPPLPDRLYAVNLDTERVELLASSPSDSPSTPGGLGNGAFDPGDLGPPVRDPVLAVPAGRRGILRWTLVATDPARPTEITFREEATVSLGTCADLPVRDIRLVR